MRTHWNNWWVLAHFIVNSKTTPLCYFSGPLYKALLRPWPPVDFRRHPRGPHSRRAGLWKPFPPLLLPQRGHPQPASRSVHVPHLRVQENGSSTVVVVEEEPAKVVPVVEVISMNKVDKIEMIVFRCGWRPAGGGGRGGEGGSQGGRGPRAAGQTQNSRSCQWRRSTLQYYNI